MSSVPLTGWLGSALINVPAVIASSGTKSAAIDLKGMALNGVKLPATFTGTAISFEMCDTADGTYVPVKSTTSGTTLSYTVAQATYAAIDPTPFQGIRYLKIVSNATEGAERTLLCSLKGN